MKYHILTSVCLSLLLFACKPNEPEKKEDPKTPPTSAEVTFRFMSKYNGYPMQWNNFYLTGAGDTVQFTDVKYIFSNFILEKTTGELVKVPDAYGFVSLCRGLDSFTIKNVPFGDYKSLRMEVGLDSAINHGDPMQWGKIDINHPLNPTVNNMHWGWSGGYIFNVVEGYYKNKGANGSFSYHVALDKNVRNNLYNYNYKISQNGRFTIYANIDKIFSNAVNFSIKTDGSFSHSGDPDPVMDQFLKNANGVITLIDFK